MIRAVLFEVRIKHISCSSINVLRIKKPTNDGAKESLS
jgi:hypothetical protein